MKLLLLRNNKFKCVLTPYYTLIPLQQTMVVKIKMVCSSSKLKKEWMSIYLHSLNLHFFFLAKNYYKSSNILGNWLDGLEKCGTLLERNYAGLLNGQWETKNSHTYLSGRWIPYNFSVIGWEDEGRTGVSFIQSLYNSTDKHRLSLSFCTHEKSPTSLPRKT